ncbi:hypothetical protein GR157_02840 [Burkholderia sp. 4701]|nr:hypothetical protein [Burkholderia sp. 4701]MXN80783.1 hypothetical protein [Burkholderia sp. 4812]
MSIRIAVLGDPTDHGGRIVSGSNHHKIGGVPVALHGHRTECGCTLIATSSGKVGR